MPLAISRNAAAIADAPAHESLDLQVLRYVARWQAEGRKVWLATVIETFGSAPRPVGSMAAINDAAQVVGSVSGGCVEDDLSDWLARDACGLPSPRVVTYGRDDEEKARLRLPCNGHIRVWIEEAPEFMVASLLEHVGQGRPMRRELNVASGEWRVTPAGALDETSLAGSTFVHVLGPTSQLVLIGASEVSRCLAPMAMGLGYRVVVIDPRVEYLDTWPHSGCELVDVMPDDALAASPPNCRTAVVALSHDPKLDDLALLEALKSPAFYVGAMGSVRTTVHRKKRLELFDLNPSHIDRLRGPVGMDIGARTPMEIAISIAADLVLYARSHSPALRTIPQ